MGAQPRLKIKTELNYRKGSTNESGNCRYCIHFVPYPEKSSPVRREGRCKIMGVIENIRYRIWSDYRCDAQQFSGTDFSKGAM